MLNAKEREAFKKHEQAHQRLHELILSKVDDPTVLAAAYMEVSALKAFVAALGRKDDEV